MTTTQDLGWLLANFADRVPGVAHAVAVSADGLLLASSRDLPRDRADQLSAIASGLVSLTQGASRCFEGDLQPGPGTTSGDGVRPDQRTSRFIPIHHRRSPPQLNLVVRVGCQFGQPSMPAAARGGGVSASPTRSTSRAIS